jgi:3-oxoacid CoA-transferase subunit A
MSKIWPTAAEALRDVVKDGSVIAVGGFGLSGNPTDLIEALRDTGAKNLTIVSNNMGVDGKGLGLLLENHQVSKVIASYVGENKLFAQQYLDGQLDVEFSPQGTLAERLRAGGAGIAGFYTKTGVGTPVAEGKTVTEFDVHAHHADREGNLIYRHTARNFNPLVAAAGRLTIAEAEVIVDRWLEPNAIITPGIFVQRLVAATPREKDIEQRTVRPRPVTGQHSTKEETNHALDPR